MEKLNKTKLKKLYLELLPKIRVVARMYGYAIAQHGSFTRDMDLVAIPWVEKVRNEKTFIKKIVEIVGGYVNGQPAVKPHGRKAYTIVLPYESNTGWAVFIDLSVISKK